MTEKPTEVYIILPKGEVHWVPEKMNAATEQLGHSLVKFIEFLETQWPELNQEEATWLAAAMIGSFPVFIQSNPELLQELGLDVARIKTGRHKAK